MTNEEFQRLILEKLNGLDKIDSRLDRVENRLDKIESEVSGVKSEVSGVKSEVSDVKSEVSGVKSEVSSVKSEVSIIKNQTAILTEFRTETNTKLNAIIEDNKSIHELLGEHEVSIRTLRRKPV